MEAAHHAAMRPTLVFLYKFYVGTEQVVDLVEAETFEEIATRVAEKLGLENFHSGYVGIDYVHIG